MLKRRNHNHQRQERKRKKEESYTDVSGECVGKRQAFNCQRDKIRTTRNTTSLQIFRKTAPLKRCLVSLNMQAKQF